MIEPDVGPDVPVPERCPCESCRTEGWSDDRRGCIYPLDN